MASFNPTAFEQKNIRQLYAIAKAAQISDWHAMRKQQLVETLKEKEKENPEAMKEILSRHEEKNRPYSPRTSKTNKEAQRIDERISENPLSQKDLNQSSNGENRSASELDKSLDGLREKMLQNKKLGTFSPKSGHQSKDQLFLFVRDPFWLHAYWEIGTPLVDRIRAAMGALWHTADPILRLFKIHNDSIGNIHREYIRDITIHGGINNWYIDVNDPPSSFMVEIGYLARDNRFFNLLSSNIVETPQCYLHDSFGNPNQSWMGVPPDFTGGFFSGTQQQLMGFDLVKQDDQNVLHFSKKKGGGVPAYQEVQRNFEFKVDTEIVIRGKTVPGILLYIKDEKIRLKDDGSFSIRFRLPERRHVFPVIATSPDGMETKTVILAIERNTKVLESVVKEPENE